MAKTFIRGLLDDPEDPQLPQYNAQGGWDTAANFGRMAAGMTTPGAVADAAGLLGGPSIRQNVSGGNYLDALLQGVGVIPGVGMLAKAGAGAKMAMAIPAAAKVGKDVAAADKLLSLHNMKSFRLDMADKLGGLPVPSIAITKPAQGFNSFGDITLVGGKEFATPSRNNPVYGSDVYSPRFPNVDEETGRIFKGFTNNGNRRYAPLTMDNVVKEMKGNIRGGESFNYGPGSIRASVTPQFRTLKDVQNARDNIISNENFKVLKDQSMNKLFELADKFHPYSQYSDSSFGHANSFANTLADIGKGRSSAWSQDYKDLPNDLKQEALNYLDYLKNMPTEYFEAKPQRAVSINEFGGAVIPHEIASEITPWLQNKGIDRIETFDKYTPGSQAEALQKFKDLMFSVAPIGLLGGAGYSAFNQQVQPGA